jgi:ribose transport system substrate-binding protein
LRLYHVNIHPTRPMIVKLCRSIAFVVLTFASIEITVGQAEQRELIKPITDKLTIIYIPKVIHPWYDVVHDGANFAVDELKKWESMSR